MIWIVIVIVALLLYAIFIYGWWHAEAELRQTRTQCWNLQTERDDARAQRDRLNKRLAELSDTQINLKAELARFQDDNEEFARVIGEQQLEIERLKKSADHATIPLQDAALVKPVRGGRGKKPPSQQVEVME